MQLPTHVGNPKEGLDIESICQCKMLESHCLRSRTIQQIHHLACHVPQSVLSQLAEEVIGEFEICSYHDGANRNHSFSMNAPLNLRGDYEENVCFETVASEGSFDYSDISDDNDEVPHGNAATLCSFSSLGSRSCSRAIFNPETHESPLLQCQFSGVEVNCELKANPLSNLINLKSADSTNQLSKPFPNVNKYNAALLFVDVSGFTSLSTLVTPEVLSNIINEYFDIIVNVVIRFGGDIVKFAGDALFAEWRVSEEENNVSNEKETLSICVMTASICGATIVAKCSEYPIFIQGKEIDLTLNVHCGISCGKIVSIHVGDNTLRREYLILGEVVEKVSEAAACASIGEIACCSESIVHLSRTCTFHQSIFETATSQGITVIARRSQSLFTPAPKYEQQTKKMLAQHDPLRNGVLRLVSNLNIDKLLRFKKLLSLYAHPVISNSYAADATLEGDTMLMGVNKLEEAELRNVFVMFITPLINLSWSGDEQHTLRLYMTLNSIMNIATKELSRLGGHLRQFIMDDKGLVLIATFGLRGSTFHNLVTERALPAAIKIRNCLSTELNVKSRIGATMGKAYCGVIGGHKRHEYAILGPSVNLAARLMACKKNPGILVNKQIWMMADSSYEFNTLTPIHAKGYLDLVEVFQPLSPLQKRWGKLKSKFVGRTRELSDLAQLAYEMAVSPSKTQSKLVLISGVSGMGKSAFVLQLIDQVKRKLEPPHKNIFISKCAVKETDSFSPFGAFACVMLDALSAIPNSPKGIALL